MKKKKRLITLAILCMASAFSVLGLFACGEHVHNYTETIVPATCTQRGYTLYKCECGEEYKDNFVESTGHSFSEWTIEKQPTESEKGLKTRKCLRESCSFSESEEIPTLEHVCIFDRETVTEKYLKSPATCDTKAVYFYSCKCGAHGNETFEYGEPLKHNYGTTEYVWSNDNKICTATRICLNNSKHTETEKATAVATITQHRQCETDELTTYVAMFKNSAFSTQTKADVITSVRTGHSFSTSWSGDDLTHWHDSICGHSLKKDEEPHTSSEWITDVNATYDNDGSRHKECSVCKKILITETLPKLEKDEITFKTLSVNGKTAVGKIPNSQTEFDFLNEIKKSGKATFKVSMTRNGNDIVESKVVEPKAGDNTYYILVYVEGELVDNYIVNLRRREMYTVSFDADDGTETSFQSVEEDSTVQQPSDPERLGYDFKGWNYDFTKPVTENISLTASWEIIYYDIVYVLNGGENSSENPLRYTVEDNLTLSALSKTGYAFTGWNNDGIILKGSTGTKTFIANWQIIVYTLTYVCGDGENNSLNVTNYTIESETIVLKDPYDINADFIEWQYNGEKITEIPKGSYGDLSLTAVWKKYDVKLKLNSDGKTYSVIGINTDKPDIVIKPIYKTFKVTKIETDAFKNCSSLTKITIPDSITSIGDSAFYGCTSLSSITIPDSVTIIGSSAFYGCKLTSIIIPDGVSSIGERAFYFCTSLTSVTIGNGVISIGYGAFSNCTSLTSVIIGNGVENIGDYAFSGCTKVLRFR